MKKDEASIGVSDETIKFDAKALPVLNPHTVEPPKVLRLVRPKIDLSVCQNNYNCIVFCPYNAIGKNEKGRPVIDYNLCTGCLICLRECPAVAITEEREV